ncbi:uncharacterized protein L201_001216 [Kwoniella dendrophila CBS 6074]|uniref:Ankyrin n=1 Tax=Kwoniella dendrophila CBS 6074 TaxID=1295534 RepID=A0AAX4JN62_9TREE
MLISAHKESQPLATSSHIKTITPKLDVVRKPSNRVRQAVRDNNVSLLTRLQHKTDLRNTDKNRLTSLSWAALEGSLEVFEWLLLDYGHDDQELSRDGDNNTILHLLASIPSLSISPFNHLLTNALTSSGSTSNYSSSNGFNNKSYEEKSFISLRMTELYFTLFPFLLDWSNSGGKTSLHVASQCGNYKFINLLYNLGADLNLTDLQGNTPLHYAFAFGHLKTIKILLEKNSSSSTGFTSFTRNFEGFTPLDFSYNNDILKEVSIFQKELKLNNEEERRKQSQQKNRDQRPSFSSYTTNNFNVNVHGESTNYNGHRRIRSTSLTSSIADNTSNSASNSNLGSSSYSSQPGRYIDQIPQQQQQQQQQFQNHPPLPTQGLAERTSSLPMSRYNSSTSQNDSLYSRDQQSINTAISRPNIQQSSSSQQSLNFPHPQSISGPANPQTVLGRPTPPPLHSSSSTSNTYIPYDDQSRPSNSRSPSMPANLSNKSNVSMVQPQGSDNGLPIPIPKEGVMMGSVMRRANSAQPGSSSIDFSRNDQDYRV